MGKSKIKNPCKMCNHSVNTKTGLQCKGACKKWAHYACLKYSTGKINDIKAGLIKISCPCPDCNNTTKDVSADLPFNYSEKDLANLKNAIPKLNTDGTPDLTQTNLCGDCSSCPQEQEENSFRYSSQEINLTVVTQTDITGSQIVCSHGYTTSRPPCPLECPFNVKQTPEISVQTEEYEPSCPHGFIAFICPTECQGSLKAEEQITPKLNMSETEKQCELCRCTKQISPQSPITKPHTIELSSIQKHLKLTQPYFLSPRMLCPAAQIKAHLHCLNPISECPVHGGYETAENEELNNIQRAASRSEISSEREQNLLYTQSERPQLTNENENCIQENSKKNNPSNDFKKPELEERNFSNSKKPLQNGSNVKSYTSLSYSSTSVTNSLVSHETSSDTNTSMQTSANQKYLFSVVEQMYSTVGNLSNQVNDLLHQMRKVMENGQIKKCLN